MNPKVVWYYILSHKTALLYSYVSPKLKGNPKALGEFLKSLLECSVAENKNKYIVFHAGHFFRFHHRFKFIGKFHYRRVVYFYCSHYST